MPGTPSLAEMHVAWERVKEDLRHRVFVERPFEVRRIELDLDPWLLLVAERIGARPLAVEPLFILPVPKGKGLVRPGAWLPLDEHVIYTALLGACYPAIYERLKWSQGLYDFSYVLAAPAETKWIKSRFKNFENFRIASEQILKQTRYVVFLDVSAYYENINLGALSSVLRDVGAPDKHQQALYSILAAWAQPAGRGIPQGITASDILAKLYLDSFDQTLVAEGIRFTRYVDDVRIFCDSEAEAKRTLVRVLDLLRQRGLQVQSKKTHIAPASAALAEIESVAPTVRNIQMRYTRKVVSRIGGDPYMPIFEIDDIIEENPDEMALAVISDEVDELFEKQDVEANRTLIHYLFNRLAKGHSDYGWEKLFGLLEPRPEETKFILEHLAKVGVASQAATRIVAFIRSEEAVYDYQVFQILDWLGKQIPTPSAETVVAARTVLKQAARPWYVRVAARRILGLGASGPDLDYMQGEYLSGMDPREAPDLLCALHSMERSRRNSLLSTAAPTDDMRRRAAALVRSGALDAAEGIVQSGRLVEVPDADEGDSAEP